VRVQCNPGHDLVKAHYDIPGVADSSGFCELSLESGSYTDGRWTGTCDLDCGTTYRFFQVHVSATYGEQNYRQNHVRPITDVFATTADCPPPTTNHPPVITCLDPTAELGSAIGCLGVGTGFGRDFAVSYSAIGEGNSWTVQATFTTPSGNPVTVDVATVVDPDGDTVAVTWANGTNPVTISGPGAGSAGFALDIHADDGNGGTADATCGGTANAQIIYNFVGFGSPLSNVESTKVRRGSAVPVKFQLFDCVGAAVTTGTHTIAVHYHSGAAPSGDPTVNDAGARGDNGVLFRYSAPNWIFNLKTNSSYALEATYRIVATLDDHTTHEVYISIKR